MGEAILPLVLLITLSSEGPDSKVGSYSEPVVAAATAEPPQWITVQEFCPRMRPSQLVV
jgi:hypothetical protein